MPHGGGALGVGTVMHEEMLRGLGEQEAVRPPLRKRRDRCPALRSRCAPLRTGLCAKTWTLRITPDRAGDRVPASAQLFGPRSTVIAYLCRSSLQCATFAQAGR